MANIQYVICSNKTGRVGLFPTPRRLYLHLMNLSKFELYVTAVVPIETQDNERIAFFVTLPS